jgi:outer membrane cobalamin receptor
VGVNRYDNLASTGVELARGKAREAIYRSDWTWSARPRISFEGAGEVRASTLSRMDAVPLSPVQTLELERFDARAVASSGFVQMQAGGTRWSITPGVRVDRWTLTDGTTTSPWVQGSYGLSSTVTLRAGTSIAHQRPTFDQLVGLRGTRNLQPETAYHADIGLEGLIGPTWRWRVTEYQRQERNVIRLPDSEYRLVGGTLQAPSFTTHYRNSLAGYARGIDFMLERRSANGLSGWASYTYGLSRYRDLLTGEEFWGDYDQRHTINAYGLYRFSDRFSASGRFRDGGYFVGARRNELRVPTYARVDLRLNRTFTKQNTRVTLFVELLNALDRNNVRYAVPGIDRRTSEVWNLFDPLFPRVPSAGLLVEF